MHAIIGDDQSVAENLSTFSAFVKQVREILADADRHSLVLLDELGAGTDPDEGAALAQAILEELAARGVLVMATTHLEPLKAFASTHPRARNASVEFDAAHAGPDVSHRLRPPRTELCAHDRRAAGPAARADRARAGPSLGRGGAAERAAAAARRAEPDRGRANGGDRASRAGGGGRAWRGRASRSAGRARAAEALGRARQEATRLLTECGGR